MKITHTARIKAALEGRLLDRPAYAAWGPHFNLQDRNAKDFAKATIDYQTVNQFDFIKVMPNGLYFTEDFGQVIKTAEHMFDDTWMNTMVSAVNDPHEWAKIRAPDLKKGALAREIEAVKRICDHFHGEVPVLPTIFSPLVWMGEMTGGYFHQEVIASHFKYSEKYAKMGMEVVAQTNQRLMEAFVEAGADGFFFACQCGLAQKIGKDLFEEYGKKRDLENLAAVQDKTWFNMVHVCHGDAATSEWFLDYPVHAVNWADQHEGQYTMAEMRARTDKVLIGGVNHSTGGEYGTYDAMVRSPSDLSGTDREAIKARLLRKMKAAMAAAGNKLILSGGCGWGPGALPRFGVWEEAMDDLAAELSARK